MSHLLLCRKLVKALKHFHLTRLLTPLCGAEGVWERGWAHQYIPGPQPEKCIQSDLELFLNSWFHGVVKAEHEDNTNIGRIDVRLLKRSDKEGSLTYWVIMELKILKSFPNTKDASIPSPVAVSTNIKAIVKGVRQARSFLENRRAEKGLLEIYDLRKDKTDDLLKKQDVSTAMNNWSPDNKVHVWPVFGSSEDARTAGFTGV